MHRPDGNDDPAAKRFKPDNLPRRSFIPERCLSTTEAPKQKKGYDKTKFQAVKRKPSSSFGTNAPPASQRPKAHAQHFRPEDQLVLDFDTEVSRGFSFGAQIMSDARHGSVDVPGRMKTKPHPLTAPTSYGAQDSSSLRSEKKPKPTPTESISETLVTPASPQLQKAFSSKPEAKKPITSIRFPVFAKLVPVPEPADRQLSVTEVSSSSFLFKKKPQSVLTEPISETSVALGPASPQFQKAIVSKPGAKKPSTSVPVPVVDKLPSVPESAKRKLSETAASSSTKSHLRASKSGNGLNDPILNDLLYNTPEIVKPKPLQSTFNNGKNGWLKRQYMSHNPSTSSSQERRANRPPPLMSQKLYKNVAPLMSIVLPPPNETAARNANQQHPPHTHLPSPPIQPCLPRVPANVISNDQFCQNWPGNKGLAWQQPTCYQPGTVYEQPGPAWQRQDRQPVQPNNSGFDDSNGRHQFATFCHQPQHSSGPTTGVQEHPGPSTSEPRVPMRQISHSLPVINKSGPGKPKTREEMMEILGKCQKRGLISVTDHSSPVVPASPARFRIEEDTSGGSSRAPSRSAVQPLRLDVSGSSECYGSFPAEEEPMSPYEEMADCHRALPPLWLQTDWPAPPVHPQSPRTPPGSPPPKGELTKEQLFEQIGSFILQGKTVSNMSKQDLRKCSSSEYYVAADPAKDELVRQIKRHTIVTMKSSVESWTASGRPRTVWCVTEAGSRPLLWFFTPGSCFNFEDTPGFDVPVSFSAAPVPLNAWFLGFKSTNRPYPYGEVRREPEPEQEGLLETYNWEDKRRVTRWKCNGCGVVRCQEDFNWDNYVPRHFCLFCWPMPNDSFWIPPGDAPPALANVHWINPNHPNWWSPKIRMNYDFVKEEGDLGKPDPLLLWGFHSTPVSYFEDEEVEEPVATQPEETPVEHEDSQETENTADSAVTMEQRSIPGYPMRTHARSSAPNSTNSAKYKALAANLANRVRKIRKSMYTSHEALTNMLFDKLRALYTKTMEFMDYRLTEQNIKKIRPNLSADIVNWSMPKFLEYIDKLTETFATPEDFMAAMQIECFYNSIAKILEILKEKSRQIVRNKRKREDRDRKRVDKNRKRKATNYGAVEGDSDPRRSNRKKHPRISYDLK